MIYILDHAIKRCKARFPNIESEKIEDVLIIGTLDGHKVNHKKAKNINAVIVGDMVLITKEVGKDEYVITVLDRRESKKNNNWWLHQEVIK